MAMHTLEPADEYWHEPDSDDDLWRESYYFDFYDPDTGMSAFTSLGYRLNKGYMGYTTAIKYDGHVYLRQDYGKPTENEKIMVEGCVYEPTVPLQEWRLRQLGPINRFEFGTDAMNRSPKEFPVDDAPTVSLDLNLTFEAIHDVVEYYTEADEEVYDIISAVFNEHYQQSGRMTGEVTIGDETVSVDGVGHRDHSWGIRDWRGPDGWKWIVAIFGTETAVTWVEVETEDGAAIEGYLMDDGETHRVDEVTIDSTFQPDGRTQDRIDFTVVDTAGREFQGVGDAETIIPVVFEYEDFVGHVQRAPTTFESADGRIGYGWSEYMFKTPAEE